VDPGVDRGRSFGAIGRVSSCKRARRNHDDRAPNVPDRVFRRLLFQPGVADVRLFSALEEAENIPALNIETPDPIIGLAMELFTSVDFEASLNAQFLSMASALELLSRPGDRPSICIELINQMTTELEKALYTAENDDRKALEDMRTTATQFWIKQSFRSSIRAVGKRTAERWVTPTLTLLENTLPLCMTSEAVSCIAATR
jgi:hypothetical protein